MKRVFIGIGWFVIIYVVVSFVVGAVVGGIAGSSTTIADGAEAGRIASTNFFHQYGTFFLIGTALIAAIGTVKGWLPYTKEED